MSTKRRVTNVILVLTTSILFSGCTKEPEIAIQDTVKIQQHADISKNLKKVMRDMNNVLYERHKSELERDDERVRYAYKLSGTLITISQEIKTYPQDSDQERFKNPEKKDNFLSLADQLKLHGENISNIASTYNMKALNEEIQNMTVTCNSCHAQFNPNGPKIH